MEKCIRIKGLDYSRGKNSVGNGKKKQRGIFFLSGAILGC